MTDHPSHHGVATRLLAENYEAAQDVARGALGSGYTTPAEALAAAQILATLALADTIDAAAIRLAAAARAPIRGITDDLT